MFRYYHFCITDDGGEKIISEAVRKFDSEEKFHSTCAKITYELEKRYPGKYWLATREIVGDELAFILR